MARKRREWHPGAVYHVMCRGNHRMEIFCDKSDRITYLNHLKAVKEEYRCRVLAYCLMTNHVHLQIETTSIPISFMMKKLNMLYAIYFNKKYNLVGHLFQDRFCSALARTYGHIVKISKYIHLNPVVAGIVGNPKEYQWSSYKDYCEENEKTVVSTERILQYFAYSKPVYVEYIESGAAMQTTDLWGLTPLE